MVALPKVRRCARGVPLEGHAYTGGRSQHETELLIELVRLTIRNQADIRGRGYFPLYVACDLSHDSLTQATALMLWQNGNVHHLIKTAAIADDAPHRHRFAIEKYLHAEENWVARARRLPVPSDSSRSLGEDADTLRQSVFDAQRDRALNESLQIPFSTERLRSFDLRGG